MKDLMDEKAALSHIDDLDDEQIARLAEINGILDFDEMVRLREENDHLKYEVRQLTRKQANPDMMAVDFPALEERYNSGKDNVVTLNRDLFKALMEARDAYQALDNFHNWFKGDICVAIEGAPELTDEEVDEAEQNNHGYTARIRKCVGEVKRLQKVVELSTDPKLLRLAYEPGNPLEIDLEPNWAVKALAYSFRNTFNEGGVDGKPPANYLSMVVKIPEDDIDLEIIVQKAQGERPAAKVTRYSEGLQEAWKLLNDWDFGRRGDSLNAETNAWVDDWKDEVGSE
jgi:hypothetical protein